MYYDELNHLHCFAIKKVIFIGLYGVVYISERLNPLLSPSDTFLLRSWSLLMYRVTLFMT